MQTEEEQHRDHDHDAGNQQIARIHREPNVLTGFVNATDELEGPLSVSSIGVSASDLVYPRSGDGKQSGGPLMRRLAPAAIFFQANEASPSKAEQLGLTGQQGSL